MFNETTCREIVCCNAQIFRYSSETTPPVPPLPPACDNPVIVTQPQSGSVLAPNPFLFTVRATGAYSYQWRKDGVDIPGANNSSYLIASSTEGDSGTYSVLIGGQDDCETLSDGADFMVSSPDNPCEHFEITSESDLGDAVQGYLTSIALTAIGGASPYTWTIISGSLPDGLTLAEDGTLSGTITGDTGVYTFTAQAEDSNAVSPCQTSKEFTLEVLDACDETVIPDVLDATDLRNWIIAWTGNPLIFDGPPYFTWDGTIPRTSAPGVHPITYRAEFLPLSPNPNYGVGVTETVDFVPLPCCFWMSFGIGCYANLNKLTVGVKGTYTVFGRSAACNGNQPTSESVMIT